MAHTAMLPSAYQTHQVPGSRHELNPNPEPNFILLCACKQDHHVAVDFLVVLQEDLAERASWVLAEEEVLLMEQQAAAGGAAAAAGDSTAGQEALANSPSSILDGLTATDINKMKVKTSSRRSSGARS